MSFQDPSLVKILLTLIPSGNSLVSLWTIEGLFELTEHPKTLPHELLLELKVKTTLEGVLR